METSLRKGGATLEKTEANNEAKIPSDATQNF